MNAQVIDLNEYREMRVQWAQVMAALADNRGMLDELERGNEAIAEHLVRIAPHLDGAA